MKGRFFSILSGILLSLVLIAFIFPGTQASAHTNVSSNDSKVNIVKPLASGVIEIVFNDRTSAFERVPFKRHYDDVDFVVNGTDQPVLYTLRYVLWIIPVQSPPINPGTYYTINGSFEGADYY